MLFFLQLKRHSFLALSRFYGHALLFDVFFYFFCRKRNIAQAMTMDSAAGDNESTSTAVQSESDDSSSNSTTDAVSYASTAAAAADMNALLAYYIMVGKIVQSFLAAIAALGLFANGFVPSRYRPNNSRLMVSTCGTVDRGKDGFVLFGLLFHKGRGKTVNVFIEP